ncbi:MAG: hypothetical protein JWQ04_24 [Pedosphaera sp.]|nr:hypothetical protein [Pedosphaera sp.]
MSTAILTTTIHVPVLLRDYAENARHYGHEEVEFIVVGDKKTPAATSELCTSLARELGFKWTCLDVEKQLDYLQRFPELNRILPWNSHQRRNVGLLYALEEGHDHIITIDDDNFLIPGSDFIGEHVRGLGVNASQNEITTASGWFNCIGMMQTNFGVVYPRGFPLQQRWKPDQTTYHERICRPVVNAGLWTGDPDIDALTRIYFPVETRLPLSHDYLTLAPGVWCPINTQNTALHRSAAPAAFMVVMGYEFSGLKICRYCDIWMSWLLRTVIDHMGGAVRFGKPVVQQNRNEHNLCKDLRDELPGMELNETLIAACRSARLTGDTYLSSYAQLAQHLRRELSQHAQGAFFNYLADLMTVWAGACAQVVHETPKSLQHELR